jgi:hypothetical protein
MKSATHPTKVRPYWHVDLKWIAGILLFFSLGFSLLLAAMYNVTQRDVATEAGTVVVASLFSPNGLDAPEDLTELRRQLAASPNKTIAPIPSFPTATITESDVDTLSPRDLRLKIFRQVIAPIYDKGVEGAAKEFTSDPDQQKKFANDAQLLQLLTKQTHDAIGAMLVLTVSVSVLFAAAVVFFSYRWGRVANLGLVFLLVSIPGTFLGLLLSFPPQDGDGGGAKALPPEVASMLGAAVGGVYFWAIWIGVALLAAAGIGKIVTHSMKRRAQKTAVEQDS